MRIKIPSLGVLFLLLVFSEIGFTNPNQQLFTPLQKSGYTQLTSHEVMMAFLRQVEQLSKNVEIDIIGESVEGREIPVVKVSSSANFASDRTKKLVVLIDAQQHGDEPSGKEALLVILRELAAGSLQDFLNDLDLLIVPQANPDGAEKRQRRNANNMDLNRNHVILSEPESQALHALFLKWMPEATLDIHETNASKKEWFCEGYIKDAEENFDGVSNLNIAPQIFALSKTMIPEVGELVENAGFRFSRYIVGGPPQVRRIRHSTTNINDGRQSMGIYNTFSFILEGKRYDDVLSHIKHRTEGQVAAITSILKTWANHKEEILSITRQVRKRLLTPQANDVIGLQMEYVADSDHPTFMFPVFDLYQWQPAEKELEQYEPVVKTKMSIRKPVAYLFSQKQDRLLEVLRKHQIQIMQLKKDVNLQLEVLTFLAVGERQEEDKPEIDVTLGRAVKTVKMKKGDYLISTSQPAGNLIPLLLEPQSSWGVCSLRSGRKYRFEEFLKVGKPYPIYRLMEKTKLNLESVK